jgi:catechol 2,3-dioxygenase-like lactoylglutathione lyase family enzyme
MTKSIRPRRMSHPNVILEDYDASLARLKDLLGAELMMDMPRAEWHACLVDIGGMIFELFAPPLFLLNSRHGPHYLGMEYEADMDEVDQALVDHGVRVIRKAQGARDGARYSGVQARAVHTNPPDCLGMDLEFYGGSFFEDDPPMLPQRVKPADYWRDQHPIGMTGLKAYTVGVSDIEAASGFVQSFLSGRPVYDTARPGIGARAVGLQVADGVVELLTPTGDGSLRRELERVGQGILSMVFGVRDLDQARGYFTGRGVALAAGTSPDRFAVDPAATCGVSFEFEA